MVSSLCLLVSASLSLSASDVKEVKKREERRSGRRAHRSLDFDLM